MMERQERWLDVNYLLSLRSVNDDDLWSRVAVAVHKDMLKWWKVEVDDMVVQ